MRSCETLLQDLQNRECDAALSALYAPDGNPEKLDAARDRAIRLMELFQTYFSPRQGAALFSGPGRTEIGGNHTDHQHGHVLCGSVDMDMMACAGPNEKDAIHIFSEGYPALVVDLNELSPVESERNTSAALVRGVAAKIREMGYEVKGFDAFVTSNVLSGSGLSSSAAYEALIGNIINHFFCDKKLDAVEIAKIGQYAENVYFGKPCGLMDQMGASVGGCIAIDFNDPAAPVVRKANYDFSASGHVLCIVDTASSHADLTDDYADIPKEMGAVAAYFGKQFLRDVAENDFRAAIPALREKCGDRAVLRAMHFYADDRRAVEEADALDAGDFARFLSLVNASGISSELSLQNAWSPSDPARQAIPLTLAVGRELLDGAGAIRVHGGGFAGTIQAFVPVEKLDAFRTGIENLCGKGRCHVTRIRPQGGCLVAE
ncbi:MAG: galactokinase [Oscillospiraceae bacterium]|nr:galactokinase [Oscillospiraceae bacterium]